MGPLSRLALIACLCAPLAAQTAVSELGSYWSGDPSGAILWDHAGSRHAFHGRTSSLNEVTTVLGAGFSTSSTGQGFAVPASLIQFANDWTLAAWVRSYNGGRIFNRRADPTTYFSLSFNGVDSGHRLQAGCVNTSAGSEFVIMAASAGQQFDNGDLVLVWVNYDSASGALRVAVNDTAWTIDSPAAACDVAGMNSAPLDIGHTSRAFTSTIQAIGQIMYWPNYRPSDAERAAVYNSGAGVDCSYFGCTGYSEPAPPVTVSLIDSSFIDDADLAGQQGLYFLRPFPCKDWAAMTCTADYIWVRSTDHDAAGGNPDGVYIGWSDSPATPPASWTLIKDGADLTTETGVTWTQLETPHLEYDGVDEVFLYAHAVDFNTSSPVQQVTHVWRFNTDFSVATYEGEALTRDGNNRNHTGYAIIHRLGAGDWIAQSLIRDSTNPMGAKSGWWSSTDGLTWAFEGEIDGYDVMPPYVTHAPIRNLFANGGTTYLADSGISEQSAGNQVEGAYPAFTLFERDGTWTGANNWIQHVGVYVENGVGHFYAKDGYQEPAVIRYYRGTFAGGTNLTYGFDADEITELDYLGTDFAQNVNAGENFIGSVYHNDSETPTTCSPTETLNGDGWTHRCNSGGDKDTEVDVTLSQPDTDSLQMVIVVTNHDGNDDLTRIVLNPLEITNPGANIQNCNSVPRRVGRTDGPAMILSGTWGAWTIGLADYPSGWRLSTFCTDNSTVDFDISLTNSYAYPLDDPQDVIGPGETATITLIMRFGAAGSDVDDLATDSFSAWRTLFPYRLSWADPRPIATWFLSSEASVNVTTNPRGFIQSITDWTDQSDFTTKLLAATDTVVSLAQGMSPKPQGVILWDPEGTEFPHSMTYVGDQTALCEITPEMCYLVGGVPLIDEMVRRLHAGGLRVGFTLRPQEPIAYGTTLPTSCDAPPSAFDDTAATYDYTGTFIKTADALSPRGNRGYRCNNTGDGTVQDVLYWQRHRDTNAEVVAELSRKIRYDVDRWRASIFYVDTNNLSGTYSHEIFDALAKEFPDLLILPEWETSNYAGSTFPYGELDLGDAGATAAEKRLYPQARRILNIMDGDRDTGASTIVAAMREGSPTLHRGWFADDSITDTETLYAQARAANGVVTLSTGERYEAEIPIVERVGGSCYPNHLAVRFASGAETLNGCNIFTEQGCSSTTLCRSTDSPCTIADTTAYRLEMHNASEKACSAGVVQ